MCLSFWRLNIDKSSVAQYLIGQLGCQLQSPLPFTQIVLFVKHQRPNLSTVSELENIFPPLPLPFQAGREMRATAVSLAGRKTFTHAVSFDSS